MCATVSARQRAQPDVSAKTRRRKRGFATRMARADHNHVERHLPIQNRAKMCASRSSGVRRPVISSNAARASCKSASTNSSGIDLTVCKRRKARALQSAIGPLDERDMTHVRDFRTIGQEIHVERPNDSSSQLVDAAAGRRAYFDGVFARPRRARGRPCSRRARPTSGPSTASPCGFGELGKPDNV